MGNGEDARRQGPSGRRGKRVRPGTRRGPDERQTWTRWSEENGVVEDEFWRTPTWCAKCRILGSGRPLRFEHWGARGDFASYLPAPLRHARIKAMKRTTQETGGLYWFGPSLWCNTLLQCVVWWIASGADDGQYKGRTSSREVFLS